jgi:hypothetical protein
MMGLDPIQVWSERHEHGPWSDEGEVPYHPPGPVPPSFVEKIEENPGPAGPTFLTAPDSQFNELLREPIGWQEAPDPIRQSDFWAAGSKIKPDARQRITSRLAIAYHETISNQTFTIGKLIGYLKVPTHVGGQTPSVIRANIQEARPVTYGSLYQVMPQPTQSGPAFSSAGFDLTGSDGYPY